MPMTLGAIAVRYGCELHGDPDVTIKCAATLESAGADAIAFLASRAYRKQLATTRAGAVILAPGDADDCPTAALVTDDPYRVYAHVARELYPATEPVPGVHDTAWVDPSARVAPSAEVAAGAVIEADVVIGERASVGPNVVVGRGSRVGNDTRLLAGAVICHEVSIGERCIVHPGAVIGADGFGNAREPSGAWTKIPQVGSARIGDDVEVGANTTIDRGAIGDTVIGSGVRLDNLIQVGHNVEIGEHTAIAALTGISGSVRIGARCMVGGQVGFVGHITIADDVVIAAGTGVGHALDKPGMYGGASNIVQEARGWRKNVIRITQLDDIARRLAAVERAGAGRPDDD